MTVTIREVAHAAGVSVATVSRVLNASGPVHAETARRVHEVVRRLRYVPHGGARSLITSRTHTIGVVLPDLYGEFFSEVLRGLDAAARRHRYHLLVSGTHADADELAALLRAMRGRVDGLVLMSPDVEAKTIAAHLPDALPVVLLNCATADGAVAAIGVDNHGGACAAVRHLVALGHRRVAHIAGAARNRDAQERRRGYRDALAEAGLDVPAGYEVAGDFSEAAGHAAVAHLLALEPPPTAVFAANDAMAVGALSALRAAGLRVPHDVALVGFDDIPLARYMDPPLTSVRVDIGALGARAFERLEAALRDAAARGPVAAERVPAVLVVRGSCGGARPPPH